MSGKKTEVKICGITSENEITLLKENSVDYMGMVIGCPKSRRNISLETAHKLVCHANEETRGKIKTVAVVVSPEISFVYALADTGFSIIQIHGDIPTGIEDVFVKYPLLKLWKAFNGPNNEELEKLKELDFVDGFVFDAAEPGSGKTFDWQSLKDVDAGGKKIILAGGLTPDNVALAVESVKPDVVDVSSGVEFTDGTEKTVAEKKYGCALSLKNPDKISKFVNNLVLA
jgi:phosphoribosylanthranilate isomerase